MSQRLVKSFGLAVTGPSSNVFEAVLCLIQPAAQLRASMGACPGKLIDIAECIKPHHSRINPTVYWNKGRTMRDGLTVGIPPFNAPADCLCPALLIARQQLAAVARQMWPTQRRRISWRAQLFCSNSYPRFITQFWPHHFNHKRTHSSLADRIGRICPSLEVH